MKYITLKYYTFFIDMYLNMIKQAAFLKFVKFQIDNTKDRCLIKKGE